MRTVGIAFLAVFALLAVACTGGASEPTAAPVDREPTPDVQAMVEAGIAATMEADQSIEATVTARVEATKDAEPTSTPEPTPTLTLAPTATPSPTPLPTSPADPASEEMEDTAKRLYDCIQENEAYKKVFQQGAMYGATAEGMTEEGAADLVDIMLSNREFFVLSYKEAITADLSTEELLRVELEGCEATAGEQTQTSSETDSVASNLYDCLQENEEYKRYFIQEAENDPTGGLTEADSRAVAEVMANNKEFFLLSFREATAEEPLVAIGLEVMLAECQGGNGTSQLVETQLADYAARHAGGPSAIYVSDLSQLAGPAPTVEQGDFDGNVPLESLENHLWLYEGPFYEELLVKARLTNPTPLEYDGETIFIQHACINRALLPCVLLETYFAPNLRDRTNGKVEFIATSFPELGLSGPDTLTLINDGTLDSATIYGGYVGSEIPAIEIQNLWGIYSSREQEFAATQAIIKDIEDLVLAETGGVIMSHN